MSLETASLPQDPAALQAFALALQAELKAVKAAAQLRSLEIEKLNVLSLKVRSLKLPVRFRPISAIGRSSTSDRSRDLHHSRPPATLRITV